MTDHQFTLSLEFGELSSPHYKEILMRLKLLVFNLDFYEKKFFAPALNRNSKQEEIMFKRPITIDTLLSIQVICY